MDYKKILNKIIVVLYSILLLIHLFFSFVGFSALSEFFFPKPTDHHCITPLLAFLFGWASVILIVIILSVPVLIYNIKTRNKYKIVGKVLLIELILTALPILGAVSFCVYGLIYESLILT